MKKFFYNSQLSIKHPFSLKKRFLMRIAFFVKSALFLRPSRKSAFRPMIWVEVISFFFPRPSRFSNCRPPSPRLPHPEPFPLFFPSPSHPFPIVKKPFVRQILKKILSIRIWVGCVVSQFFPNAVRKIP